MGVSVSEFELRLSENNQARVLFRTEKGEISKFIVQLERKNRRWVPIVRFDTAHGEVHKHTFRPDGTQEITKLKFADYKRAFTYTYQYVKLHWQEMTEKELFEQNLNQLETFTQYVLEHPDTLDTLPKGARLVFLPEDNPELRKENLKILKRERIDRPVAFVRMVKIPQIKEVVTTVPQLEVCHSPKLAPATA